MKISKDKSLYHMIIKKAKMLFNNMPLFQKLLSIFSISLGIGLFFAVGIFCFMSHSYNQLLYEQTEKSMSFFVDNIENSLSTIETISKNCISDSVIQQEMGNLLAYKSTDYSYKRISEKLESTLVKNFYSKNDLITMSLFQNNNIVTSVGKHNPLLSSEIYINKGMTDQSYQWNDKDWIAVEEDNSLLYIRQIREIEQLSLRDLGYLVIRIDFEQMVQDAMNAYSKTDEQFLLFTKEDEIFYSSQETDDINTVLKGKNYQICNINGIKTFVIFKHMKKYNWNVYYGISYHDIFHSIRFVIIISLFILCFDVTFTCLLWNKGISKILWHFEYLQKKIERFKKEQKSTYEPMVYDYSMRKDEIAIIHQNFDDMTMQINDLIRENYEKQLLIRDTKIQALEQQMNPHFLQNMLQVIEWHVKLRKTEETAAIVNSLGAFLRKTMVDNNEKIQLLLELETVHDYIQLMKACYEDELIFTLDMNTLSLKWTHTQAETDGGSGLAMMLEGKNAASFPEKAPGMHYKIQIRQEGLYHIWLLVKFDDDSSDSCYLALDGTIQNLEEQYSKGRLFTYSMKQRWNWQLISDMQFSKGIHVFSILGNKPGLRIDRIFMTKNNEKPPIDKNWKTSMRFQ